MRVIRLDTIDSTMLEARRMLASGETPPFAVIAKTQTGGVGRLGRPWSSPIGGVWLTVALPVPSGAAPHPLTSIRAATLTWIECSSSLHADWTGRNAMELFDQPLHIKWPNDLVDSPVASARKVAGVLIERVAEPSALLCGVGINVNNDSRDLPAQVAPRATSLSTVRGSTYDDTELAALGQRLIVSLASTLTNPTTDDVMMTGMFSALMWRPQDEVPITLPSGDRARGRIVDITDDGGLKVIIDGEQRTLRSVDQIG